MISLITLDTIDFAIICLLVFVASIIVIEIFYFLIDKIKENRKNNRINSKKR